MLLYRYFNLAYGLEALQTGRWKIGRITELNDPLDCTPHLIFTGLEIPPTVNQSDVAGELLKLMAAGMGLLCFSQVIDDPVVWSHYADAHRGLALGFDLTDEDDVEEVQYSHDRCGLDVPLLFKWNNENDAQLRKKHEKELMRAYRTKANSWSYEKEFRAIIDLEKCDLRGVHYFRSLPAKLLRQVVLGARCSFSIADIKRILRKGPNSGDASSERYSEVEVRKCVSDEASFSLKFKDED